MHELHGMCVSEVCGVMVQVGHCSGVGVFFVWMRESVVRCWDIQCSGKEAECGECGQRGVGEGRLLGSV